MVTSHCWSDLKALGSQAVSTYSVFTAAPEPQCSVICQARVRLLSKELYRHAQHSSCFQGLAINYFVY